ncbi:MAG: 1-acyl-sn-glycerol-3-phosphate acyltransferase [Candidatus Margulisbacteria bacterium]|jgi:1-acyl-sn-glycerol-3-phosphate acyltransferase|nr:1-acyl-sn-glycerol-3-phosphate acyltransferase [Candidatus Margulisiibacteriota bacterium]
MAWLFSAYFFLLCLIGLLILAVLAWLLLPLGDLARPLYYAIFRQMMKLLLACTFIRVEVVGAPQGKMRGGSLWVAEHPGLLEPLYLVAARPERLRLVADSNILRVPLLGRVLKSAGCLIYELGGTDVAFLLSLREALQRGEQVLVFPPALRRLVSKPAELDDALVRTARLCGAAIIPLLIEQPPVTSEYLINPGRVRLKIGSPWRPAGPAEKSTLANLFRVLEEGK